MTDCQRLHRYGHFTVLRICYRGVFYQFSLISLTLPPLVNVTLTCHYSYMTAVLNVVSLGG